MRRTETEKRISAFLALLFVLAALAAGVLIGVAVTPKQAAPSSPSAETVETVFSPGSEARLVAFVDSTQRSIDVELYEFSNSALKAALVRAAQRGVRVRLILEPKVDSNLGTADFLGSRGVLVRWGSQKFSNTHAKSAVADANCVLAGSINWSQHAVDSNREAAFIVCGGDAPAEFERVFEADWTDATTVAS